MSKQVPQKKKNNNNSVKFKLALGFIVVATSFLGYIIHQETKNKKKGRNNGNNNQSRSGMITPGYIPTPLGDDIDMKVTSSNNFTTTNGEYNPQNGMNKDDWLRDQLLQRRTLSVLENTHLNHGNREDYFHLGLNSTSNELNNFKNIKWVLFVKSKADVILVANRLIVEIPQLNDNTPNKDELMKPIGNTDRYYMLCISPIIIVSCGLGSSSFSILLNEISKLLVDAGAFDTNNKKARSYSASYVEYIYLQTAPGIHTAPSKFMHRRTLSHENIFKTRSSKDNNNNMPFSSTPTSPNKSFIFDRQRSQPNIKNIKSMSITPKSKTLSSLKVDLKKEREMYNIRRNSNNNSNNKSENRPSQVTHGEVPVIIPSHCFNENLKNEIITVSCGHSVLRLMKFDKDLISDIKLQCNHLRKMKPKTGKCLSVKYLHESLSHNSMAIKQDPKTKSIFIQSCVKKKIKFVDTESGMFAGFCNKTNISACTIAGIKYDIASPNSNAMRVSHEQALHATLDVFCQYLWDRLYKQNSKDNITNISSINNNNNNINNNKFNDMDSKEFTDDNIAEPHNYDDNSMFNIDAIEGDLSDNNNDINNNNNNNDSKQDNDVNINSESDNKMREIALLYLNVAAGMIEGALINLNKNAEVNVELKKKSWPECFFTIKIKKETNTDDTTQMT